MYIITLTYSLKILKESNPVGEFEKNNAAAEPVMSFQDTIIEKRPETDFHFFSDTEVTKYVISICKVQ